MSLCLCLCVWSSVLLTGGFVASHNCRSIGIGGICLYGDEKNWPEAKASCQVRGGHLYRVEDEASREHAQGLMNRFQVERVWIGARSISTYWNWIDALKKKKPLHYQGCYPSESERGHALMQENCARVNKAYHCKDRCKSYKFYSLGKMYGTFWPLDRRERCCCGNTFATQGKEDKCSSNKCNPKYICSQDENIANSVYSLNTPDIGNLWASGHPKGVLGPHQCVVIDDFSLNHPRLKTVPCSRLYCPLCALDKIGACNEVEVEAQNGNYCLMSLSKTFNWEDAATACDQLDISRRSHLASAVTISDLKMMKGKIKTAAWVSATSRVWTWDTGDSMETEVSEDNWEAEDNQLPMKGRCLQMNKEGKWASADCNHTAGYLCMFALLLNNPTTTLTPYASSSPKEEEVRLVTGLSPASRHDHHLTSSKTQTTSGAAFTLTTYGSHQVSVSNKVFPLNRIKPTVVAADDLSLKPMLYIGIVGLVLVAAIAIAIVVYIRRKKRQSKKEEYAGLHRDGAPDEIALSEYVDVNQGFESQGHGRGNAASACQSNSTDSVYEAAVPVGSNYPQEDLYQNTAGHMVTQSGPESLAFLCDDVSDEGNSNNKACQLYAKPDVSKKHRNRNSAVCLQEDKQELVENSLYQSADDDNPTHSLNNHIPAPHPRRFAPSDIDYPAGREALITNDIYESAGMDDYEMELVQNQIYESAGKDTDAAETYERVTVKCSDV